MKTITINARNTTREFEASDIDTVMTVLAHADVRTLFGFDDDATDECVSTKVVKIIQSYTGIVNKMVWRKF
jgi:UDP-N-acetylglucosamine 2-epimerase